MPTETETLGKPYSAPAGNFPRGSTPAGVSGLSLHASFNSFSPMLKLRCFFLLLLPLMAAAAETSPYAAETGRRIKALSESDISAYLAGRGMGLARAAELNRYPGPRHVLDLRAELALTAEQVATLQEQFRTMEAAAKSAGAELVAREAELDRLFADRRATPEQVHALTGEIGRLHGLVRAAHLNAHVATTAALTPEQISRYAALRGYEAAAASRPAARPHAP
jgi:hypothetical protein